MPDAERFRGSADIEVAAREVVGPTQEQLNGAAADVENWLYATHDYSG